MIKKIHMVNLELKKHMEMPFYPGLNIVLADRDRKSGSKGTRNGVGKSTLIEILDFCLGADPNKDHTLPADSLHGWEFTLEIEVGGRSLSVRRTCDESGSVFVLGDMSNCPVRSSASPDLITHEVEYSSRQWKDALGWLLFDLDPTPSSDAPKSSLKYETLIGHFIRKSFDNPLTANPGEYKSRTELAVTYLLGLDYLFLEHARLVKKERKAIESRRSAAVDQASSWVKEIAQLKHECELMKVDLEHRKAALDNFATQGEFAKINESLYDLTVEYHNVIARKVANERNLKSAIESKAIRYLPFETVKGVYEKAGAIFAANTLRHMDDVKAFHEQLQKKGITRFLCKNL